MAPSRRRVSYMIPPPTDDIPRLRLPPLGFARNGSIRPIIVPSEIPLAESKSISEHFHPRHRLGVMSLALDTTTHLEGRNAPEGILYTGGRDGLVISWDLGLPFKRRHDGRRRRAHSDRWEILTGMSDEPLTEDDDEDERRDGDVLGDVKEGGGRRRRGSTTDQLPYELQWQLDVDSLAPGLPSNFRQCAQTHTDWVNDILLCNYNQTVVSASSDGMIKAWHPHTLSQSDPSAIGFHSDYARCLSLCREQNWIASGSFDRTIKLWDLTRASTTPEPFLTLNPPDATAPKASVYALASDPYGHAIASGSPERVIRMWDPRSGKRTGKLVGHTDNIRAILISDDARYLLTGSADASIKLWSLSSQRCLHTFAYHTDSVWSLESTHPSLEVFYSGDKSGVVCKVDVEGCGDVTDGTCIVVARESSIEVGEGISKIVTADDGILWTASGNSNISRWRLPGRALKRALDEERELADSSAATVSRRHISLGRDSVQWSAPPSIHQDRREDGVGAYPGVPPASFVRLTSPDSHFSLPAFPPRGRDPEVATLYSAASVISVPGGRPQLHTPFHHASTLMPPNTLRSMKSDLSISHASANPAQDPRTTYEYCEYASDADPLNANPDTVISGSHGLVRGILLNDRMHALTVDTKGEVAVWDIIRGLCRGWFAHEEVRAASRRGSTVDSGHYARESGSVTRGDRERSPREALEAVRERIEGEAVISPWSSVDTKTGVLTVHINERCFDAEIYADEAGFGSERHFNDELRFNIGRWVLRNLFLGFIREEQRIRRKHDTHGSETSHSALHRASIVSVQLELNGNSSSLTRPCSSESSMRPPRTSASTAVITSSTCFPAVLPSLPSLTRTAPLVTSLIPLVALKSAPLPSMPQSPDDATPVPRPIRTHGLDTVGSPPSASRDVDYFTSLVRRPSTASTALSDGGDFSAWSGPSSALTILTPNTPSGGGGLMGRLKNLGKGAVRKAASDTVPGSPISSPSGNATDTPTVLEAPVDVTEKSPAQALLDSENPISPPTSSDAPTLALPPAMTILISDEVYPGWRTVYRGCVSTTWADVYKLELTMPLWLAEYLLFNKTTGTPAAKVSFVLVPWVGTDSGYEVLPELLNSSQSKLTASRFLRVRKLTQHVQEKLDKLSGSPTSLHSPTHDDNRKSHDHVRGEDLYEILCNDVLLPLDMTLAAVRHYFWRQAGELVMHYRLKARTSAPGSNGSTSRTM